MLMARLEETSVGESKSSGRSIRAVATSDRNNNNSTSNECECSSTSSIHDIHRSQSNGELKWSSVVARSMLRSQSSFYSSSSSASLMSVSF